MLWEGEDERQRSCHQRADGLGKEKSARQLQYRGKVLQSTKPSSNKANLFHKPKYCCCLNTGTPLVPFLYSPAPFLANYLPFLLKALLSSSLSRSSSLPACMHSGPFQLTSSFPLPFLMNPVYCMYACKANIPAFHSCRLLNKQSLNRETGDEQNAQ